MFPLERFDEILRRLICSIIRVISCRLNTMKKIILVHLSGTFCGSLVRIPILFYDNNYHMHHKLHCIDFITSLP